MLVDEPSSVRLTQDGFAVISLIQTGAAKAFPLVDPETAAAIAKAAVDYYQSQQVGAWQKSVGDRLNLILNKLDSIVDEIRKAVKEVIANNDANWQSFYATNLRGPGETWSHMDAAGTALTSVERDFVASTFHSFSLGVQHITDSLEYKPWGFVLVSLVRTAFPYSLLAAKLGEGRLTKLIVASASVRWILNYLQRSVKEGPDEPMSLANALSGRRTELAAQIASMDSWCNGWVRVSDVSRSHMHHTKEGDGGDPVDVVLVGRIAGGAWNPSLQEVRKVTSYDGLFGASYYPDFPGSIEAHEDEKARLYCNDRIQRNAKQRDDLHAAVTTLAGVVKEIHEEIEVVQKWLVEP